VKTRDWQKLLNAQTEQGKTLFTLTELANLSGSPRHIVNVEMTRLVKYGAAIRYAKGLYGLPSSTVSAEQLVASLDPHAYITAHYALMRHGLVMQVPTVIGCFTSRRHFRREMETPIGRIEFICVRPPVFRNETDIMAEPEQALWDFVYIALRRGQNPTGLVTLRRPERLRRRLLKKIAKRYPATVGRCIAAMT
jgi:hypothetical protein